MTDSPAFCGNLLLRDSEKRTDTSLTTALNNPLAGVYLALGRDWLCKGDEANPQPLFTVTEARALGAEPEQGVLLGWTAQETAPRIAARLPETMQARPESLLLELRSAAMRHVLDADTEAQLAQAQHFLHWHRRNRFCGVCGSHTLSESGGYRRRCTSCNELYFPRTDPVVIMLVYSGDKCLMGRQPHFAPGTYSALAGFVEPGETLEAAVRREVMEEAGIATGKVSYHSSQPWPFPGTLMIGCLAEAHSTDIRFDREELEDCRWFTRDEVVSILAQSHPEGIGAPMRHAIAFHLLRHFAET
ncbi:NAD(+) diphosphatase [Aureimonas fodinaquatilis]|uniref:NAD(+) diphosphatase n=1 Tax=Aureimonas fodinaquatilis TaxID=2565783 RepID=A0A5B0E3J4_9HYPH|nr:NAD(+) diphosphatase [Aureimonas fodinaquatilis]KAA0972340.1 NAD(+) diphosphatase [Aureimonas fodinaquatilis]